jgi:ankyrin repeat protein
MLVKKKKRLHWAVLKGYYDCADYLLKKGADKESKDASNNILAFYTNGKEMQSLFMMS